MERIGYNRYKEAMRPPLYEHDSDCCTYLGQFAKHDLYYCPQGNIPTVIARFGSDGWQYCSGMAFANHPAIPDKDPTIKAMRVAKSRAIQAKLYTPQSLRKELDDILVEAGVT